MHRSYRIVVDHSISANQSYLWNNQYFIVLVNIYKKLYTAKKKKKDLGKWNDPEYSQIYLVFYLIKTNIRLWNIFLDICSFGRY